MTLSRYSESVLRQVISVLPVAERDDPDAVLRRLEQLQRGLEPEDEFALLISWLGRCQLAHKLNQEQLPLLSTTTYRVPDILAVFEYAGRLLPVLIEVKTEKPPLSLRPHLKRYADLLGLPLLIAWKHEAEWSLFDFERSTLAVTNYRADVALARLENLLGILAGDFTYRLSPGTTLRMPIRKLSEPDAETGGFDGQFHDIHFVNPAGERIPAIRHLGSLFMFWENEARQEDRGNDIVQDFVVPETQRAETASHTLALISHTLSALGKERLDWQTVLHDRDHVAHDIGRLKALVSEGGRYGVIEDVATPQPLHVPTFLA
jgi:hypothetical protein